MRICLNILTQTAGLSDPTNAVGTSTEWLRLPGTPDNVTDGVDNLRAMVRRYVRGGADFIKIATTGGVSSRVSGITSREFTYAEVEAVVSEARAMGRHVAAHAYAGEGLKNALRAGVRTVEHLGPLDDEDIVTIVRQGTHVVPTLLNMHVRRQPHIAATLSAFSRDKAEELAPLQPALFRRLHRAGARIAAGTDARPFEQGGNARELALLVRYGMTPSEAIVAATSVAADCCEVPDTGRLRPGMRADFIAVDGDPLEDIEVLTHEDRVRLVCRDGIVFKDTDGRAAGLSS
ncbi:MAG: amidohydrolase family protein [Armatimonadetes bacterium]|nr:amidohydrolase family protein [Armatimonadota bacterium]